MHRVIESVRPLLHNHPRPPCANDSGWLNDSNEPALIHIGLCRPRQAIALERIRAINVEMLSTGRRHAEQAMVLSVGRGSRWLAPDRDLRNCAAREESWFND